MTNVKAKQLKTKLISTKLESQMCGSAVGERGMGQVLMQQAAEPSGS